MQLSVRITDELNMRISEFELSLAKQRLLDRKSPQVWGRSILIPALLELALEKFTAKEVLGLMARAKANIDK